MTPNEEKFVKAVHKYFVFKCDRGHRDVFAAVRNISMDCDLTACTRDYVADLMGRLHVTSYYPVALVQDTIIERFYFVGIEVDEHRQPWGIVLYRDEDTYPVVVPFNLLINESFVDDSQISGLDWVDMLLGHRIVGSHYIIYTKIPININKDKNIIEVVGYKDVALWCKGTCIHKPLMSYASFNSEGRRIHRVFCGVQALQLSFEDKHYACSANVSKSYNNGLFKEYIEIPFVPNRKQSYEKDIFMDIKGRQIIGTVAHSLFLTAAGGSTIYINKSLFTHISLQLSIKESPVAPVTLIVDPSLNVNFVRILNDTSEEFPINVSIGNFNEFTVNWKSSKPWFPFELTIHNMNPVKAIENIGRCPLAGMKIHFAPSCNKVKLI